MWSGKPVTTEIWARLPVSLEIAVLGSVLATVIAIPLGTLSALRQNSWLDLFVRVFAIGGIDATTLDGALAAGASRVAVVRAITQAADAGAASAALLARLAQVKLGHPGAQPADQP